MRRIRLIDAEAKPVGSFDIENATAPAVVKFQGRHFALVAPPDNDPGTEPAVRTYRETDVVDLVGEEVEKAPVVGDQADELAEDEKGDAQLRDDGPTLVEYVAAGYSLANYPPRHYAAKPYTDDEKAEAQAIEDARKAAEADKDDPVLLSLDKATSRQQLRDIAAAQGVTIPDTVEDKVGPLRAFIKGELAKKKAEAQQ